MGTLKHCFALGPDRECQTFTERAWLSFFIEHRNIISDPSKIFKRICNAYLQKRCAELDSMTKLNYPRISYRNKVGRSKEILLDQEENVLVY